LMPSLLGIPPTVARAQDARPRPKMSGRCLRRCPALRVHNRPGLVRWS
jgi:hypothetical protein